MFMFLPLLLRMVIIANSYQSILGPFNVSQNAFRNVTNFTEPGPSHFSVSEDPYLRIKLG